MRATLSIPQLKPIKEALKLAGVDCGVKATGSVILERCQNSSGTCVVHSAKLCVGLALECGVGPKPRRRPG